MPRTREQNYQVVTPSTGLIGGGANLTPWRAGTGTRNCRHPWTGIAWSPTLGLFAACASDGFVGVSADGNDWLPASYPASSIFRQWQSIVWCPVNGIFCAIANNGSLQVLVSVVGAGGPPSWHLVEDTPPEVRAWSALTVLTVDGTEAVCAVAGDDSGAIALSLDCHNWTEHFGATGEDNAYFTAACWSDTNQEMLIVSDGASSGLFGSLVTMGLTGGVFNPTFKDISAMGSLRDDSTWSGVAWSDYLSVYMAVSSYRVSDFEYIIYSVANAASCGSWPTDNWPRNAVIYVPDFYMLYILSADALESNVSKITAATGTVASTDGTKFGQTFYIFEASGDRTLEYIEIYLTVTTPGTYEMYAELWTSNLGLPNVLIAQSDNYCYVEGSGYYRFYFNKEHLYVNNYYVFSINGMTGVSYSIDTTYIPGNRVTYDGATWTGQANDVGKWKVEALREITSGTNGWGTQRTYVWSANIVRQGIGDIWKGIAYAPEIRRFCAVGECGWTMIQDVFFDMENVLKNVGDLIPELEFQNPYHDRVSAKHQEIGRIGLLTSLAGQGREVTLNGCKAGLSLYLPPGTTILEWYDTGTFSPTSYYATVDGPAPITVIRADYTCIGGVCFIDMEIYWGAQTGSQAAQPCTLTGFPFNARANVRSCLKIDGNYDTAKYTYWKNQSPVIFHYEGVTVLHMKDPANYSGGTANDLAEGYTSISGFYFI